MKATDKQIKDFLGAFKILFSEEEIKNITKGEDKDFVKTVVCKIDKFLAQTFKELKSKSQRKSIKIYYVRETKKLTEIKTVPLDKEDCEMLNNPKFKDPQIKIFNKYLDLLSKNEKKTGYYIGVFRNVRGETIRTVAGIVN